MGLITITGESGCRQEEVARLTAQRLDFELVTESRLDLLVNQEFGTEFPPTPKAYPHILLSILARLATEHHLVVCAPGVESLFKNMLGVLRVKVVAPPSRRLGTLMLERRLDRPAAGLLLKELEKQSRVERKRKFGSATASQVMFDMVLSAEFFETEHMAELIGAAVNARGLVQQGLLSAAADAQLQFQVRLQLAKHGIMPSDKIHLKRSIFMHPSEEVFANMLDFYRIAWEYEPRSFPISWDNDGKVLESFTPDFYLPEFDLYLELTTMKQSLVTKKNRKLKLLGEIYPHINIRVFYQKDFQNLIFKYGLTERLTHA